MEQKISVELTEQEWSLIGNLLIEHPYKIVAGVLHKLNAQVMQHRTPTAIPKTNGKGKSKELNDGDAHI